MINKPVYLYWNMDELIVKISPIDLDPRANKKFFQRILAGHFGLSVRHDA